MSALPVADGSAGPRRDDERPGHPGVVHGSLAVLRAAAAAGTELAAFHRALRSLDLAHYNLVRLSSVIPPSTPVVVGGPAGSSSGADDPGARALGGRWGDRLYCVYAEASTCVPGEQVWAAVGWVQRRDGQGGFFVEHEGGSETAVVDQVRRSLADMVADEDVPFGPPGWVVQGATCEGDPVCALVVVPYAVAGWTGSPTGQGPGRPPGAEV